MPESVFVLTTAMFWFAGALCVAAWTDVRSRLIPNRFVVALAAGSLLLVADGRLSPATYGGALAVALAALLCGAILFARGWIGGGDVKLLAAALLWVPPGAALILLQVTLLVGAALSLGMIAARSLARHQLLPAGLSGATLAEVERGVPYGVAIAAGGILTFQFVWF